MIDRIDGMGRSLSARRGGGAIRGAGSTFRVPDAGIQAEAAALGAALSPSLIGMIGLQADPEAHEQVADREALRQGRDMLKRLASLQREMLLGRFDGESLHELAGLADSIPEAADPALRAALAAIELRVRVEIARAGAKEGPRSSRE